MKRIAEIDGQQYTVEIDRHDRKVTATVDGRPYEIEFSEPEPNVYLIKHNGKVVEIRSDRPSNDNELVHVRVGTDELDIRLLDPRKLRHSKSNDHHGDGLAEIRTAMPGKIVRIIAQAGEEVKKGDGVIVVEAMKMQNEMRSPKDGVIKEVKVEEGSTVNAGELLVIIE
jgi:biotin carboxyl carrier protein